MSSLTFKDFCLSQATITGKKQPEVVADSIRNRYKIDPETSKPTTELEGVSVDIIAAHGKCQTVKLPMACKETADKIAASLKNDITVWVDFGNPSTLRGKCYAMLNNNGKLISGISASASELNIVRIEAPEYDLN